MTAEIVLRGWKDSSLRMIAKADRTHRWDAFSFFLKVTGIKNVLSNLFFVGAIAWIWAYVGSFHTAPLGWLPWWALWPSMFLFFDFCSYWCHRIRHLPWFWLVHEYHHSSTQVTALTTYRVHPLDHLFYLSCVLAPLQFLFGPEFSDNLIFILVQDFWGIFNHTRIDYRTGWWSRYVFISPRFHHLHHSRSEVRDRNFGETFVFWDRLFGTYTEPTVPLAEVSQGIDANDYESGSPIRAYLRPVWQFYLWPFRAAKNFVISSRRKWHK